MPALMQLVLGNWYKYKNVIDNYTYFQPMQLNSKNSNIKVCNMITEDSKYFPNVPITDCEVWRNALEVNDLDRYNIARICNGLQPATSLPKQNYSIWN